jgi:hypothetical protein
MYRVKSPCFQTVHKFSFLLCKSCPQLSLPEARPPKCTKYRFIHYNENPISVFLFWELRSVSPKFHINVSVSNLYIPFPGIGPHIFLQQNRQTDPGNI